MTNRSAHDIAGPVVWGCLDPAPAVGDAPCPHCQAPARVHPAEACGCGHWLQLHGLAYAGCSARRPDGRTCFCPFNLGHPTPR